MIRVLADSASIVLRSTHVLVVRIATSTAEEWEPTADGRLERSVDVGLRLEERLKGTTRQEPGDEVGLRVVQFSSTSPWLTPQPGVWSDLSVAPGTRLVAFAHSISEETAELLVEPACEQLMPAEEVLADVRLSLRAESEELGIAALVGEAREAAASLGPLFVEYLWEVHGAELLREADGCELMAELLEEPGLALPARAMLLSRAVEEVAAGAAIAECRARLVQVLFRLLSIEAAAPLRDNLLDVYLPALLGLGGGEAAIEASQVFADDPPGRRAAAARLRELSPGQADLLGWLG